MFYPENNGPYDNAQTGLPTLTKGQKTRVNPYDPTPI